MKLDFNIPLMDIKRVETKQKLNELLADLLASETGGNPRKLTSWYLKLGDGQVLELDAEDAKVIESIVENTPRMMTLVKGQILAVIDSAKEQLKAV